MTELTTGPHTNRQPAAAVGGWPQLPGLDATVAASSKGAGRARRRLELTDRDVTLLRWIGEQYCARGDLLAVLMARHSTDDGARTAGRVSDPAVRRRVGAWRAAGLVATERFRPNHPATVWLTGDGMAAAGLAWRATVTPKGVVYEITTSTSIFAI